MKGTERGSRPLNRAFDCGASKRSAGPLRRMSGFRPSSVAVLWVFNVNELARSFKWVLSSSLSPLSADGKLHNLLLFFNSPRRSHFFFTRCTTSA